MDINDIFSGLVRYPSAAAHNLPTLSAQQLNAHPAGNPNSIAWLLWHSGREIDAQLADLSDGTQQWENYRERFNLGELGDSMGYGHTPQQAAEIKVDDQNLLLDYLDTTLRALGEYAGSLSQEELDEVIDRSWEEPVTRGVRLLSIIDDATVHVGQAAYAAGALTQ